MLAADQTRTIMQSKKQNVLKTSNTSDYDIRYNII